MAKQIRIVLVFFLSAFIFTAINAQEKNETKKSTKVVERNFNKKYVPLSIVRRLSYENYKNIKLLHTAILNFGGGENEFDRVVDDYAEASALYFSKKFVESANLYIKNEKDITAVARKLAKKYKEVTEKLHGVIVRLKIKAGIKISLRGKKLPGFVDRVLRDGSYSLNRANDYEVRSRPIDAIFLYRRAKIKYLNAYKAVSDSCTKLAKQSSRKSDRKYFTKLAIKYKFPAKYKKDLVDSKNKIYEAREKKN